MKTISINEANALLAYKNTDSKGKALLADLIGKELFNQKITDRVKTFEDACAVLSVDPSDFEDALEELTPDEKAYRKLKLIVRALNQGWSPDWENAKQPKYFIWMEYKSGSGFSLYNVYYDCAYSCVPSRLCFESRELAEYCARQFRELINDYFTK